MWVILTHCNIVPSYETILVKSNSIIPKTNLFAGQKIQLDFQSVRYLDQSEIIDAEWKISSHNQKPFYAHGLQPIIVIPPAAPGIYNLSLTLKLKNETLEGASNIYLVQDKPQKLSIASKKIINFSQQIESAHYASVKNNEKLVEVYTGKGIWTSKIIQSNENNSFISLDANEQIYTINNSIIVRNPEQKLNLNTYYSIPLH